MMEERTLPRLTAMVDHIGAIIAGQCAQTLLDQDPNEVVGTVMVLPSWLWLVPVIDVGRKGVTVTGEKVRMPSRIVWDSSPVIVLRPGETREIGYHVTGLGHDESGTITVSETGGCGVHLPLATSEDLSPEVRPFASPRGLARILRDIVKRGTGARWELVAGLEHFTMNKLVKANSMVAAELREHTNHASPTVLDELSVDDLLAKMLYGENGSSVITRMVDRALNPGTFQRVDPMHYFAVGIRARAEEAIRQRIGDPKVGPKVRRILAKSQAKTLDDLLVAYRAAYPRDSLAKKRALAALTAGPEIAVHQRLFHESMTEAGGDA